MARRQEPFFDAEGRGSTRRFLGAWAAAGPPTRAGRSCWAPPTTTRPAALRPPRPEQLGAALTFLFTWGSVPCVYYGDEIGMRYLRGMPDVEGAICNPAYNRAGCRTPMQWDDGPNAASPAPTRPALPAGGPGAGPADRRRAAGRPSLHAAPPPQARRPAKATPALGGRAGTRVRARRLPFAYVRGDSHLVVVNPRRDAATVTVAGAAGARSLLAEGVALDGERLSGDAVTVAGFGYRMFALDR